MKILRTILFIILLVAGIILASVNMTPVKFIYLPAFEFLQSPPQEGSREIPLALLLLAAIVVGSIIAGSGTFLEHVRLRYAVRRQAKVNAKLRADVERLTSEAEQARASAESRQAEAAAATSRADKAEAEATKAQLEAARARARVEELTALGETDEEVPALGEPTPAQ